MFSSPAPKKKKKKKKDHQTFPDAVATVVMTTGVCLNTAFNAAVLVVTWSQSAQSLALVVIIIGSWLLKTSSLVNNQLIYLFIFIFLILNYNSLPLLNSN